MSFLEDPLEPREDIDLMLKSWAIIGLIEGRGVATTMLFDYLHTVTGVFSFFAIIAWAARAFVPQSEMANVGQ